MKNFFRAILFFVSNLLITAQVNQNVLVIQYESKLAGNHMKSTLVGKSEKSIFFYSNSSEHTVDNVFANTKININPYYLFIYDFDADLMYKSLNFSSIEYLKRGGMSVDKYPELVWKIKNESKIILGFNCKNASTSFRGRDYEVWFTTEISGNYFPWKFKGLPGTILSFSDKENLFSAEAISVTQNKNVSVEFEERIDKYFLKYKNSTITYKADVENDNKWLQERRNERIASLPSGTNVGEVPPLRELDFEKSFEWETNTKKP